MEDGARGVACAVEEPRPTGRGRHHAARGNTTLLTRGVDHIEPYQDEPAHGIDIAGLLRWARGHAAALEAGADQLPVPRLRGDG